MRQSLERIDIQCKLFKFYVVVTFLVGFLSAYIKNPLLNVFDDGVFLILLVISFLYKRTYSSDVGFIGVVLVCFFCFWSLIALLEGNSLSAVGLSFRQYKNIFLFFIIASLYTKQDDFITDIIEWALVVSLPLSIFQFIFFDDIDAVSGVFGDSGSGILSLVIIFYVGVKFAERVKSNNNLTGAYLLLAIPCLINETKITFVLLPVIMFVILYVYGKVSFFSFIKSILFCCFLFFVVDYIYVYIYQTSYLEFFEPENIERYLFEYNEGWDIGRFQRLIIAYQYLNDLSLWHLYFGEGLGSSFAGVNSGVYGNAAESLNLLGMNEGSRIQLYHFFIDFGLVGTSLLILIFLSVLATSIKSARYNNISLKSMLIIIIFLFGVFYQNILTGRVLSLMFFYYLYMAVFVSRNSDVEVK